LLSALVAARYTYGRGLTDTEIADQVVTFFMGGTETIATTLAWALYLLDRHPDIAARLHNEVDTVLAGRLACHADLPRLALTGRIITETLRLYPPTWFLTRVVAEDTDLGGRHRLCAGTTNYRPLFRPCVGRYSSLYCTYANTADLTAQRQAQRVCRRSSADP
jgi:cytochrome P450